MRICFVHGNVTTKSGSGRYIWDLATRFAEDGHQVVILCHDCEAPSNSVSGLEVVRVDRPPDIRGLWRIGSLLDLRHLARAIPPALGARRFDALIGSDLLFLRAVRQVYGPRPRFIYTPLSMIAPLEIRSYQLGGIRGAVAVRLYRELQQWALVNCDRVVRFTASAVLALEQYYRMNLSHKQCVAIYVSRQFEKLSAGLDPADQMTVADGAQLLWVGRLVQSKNVAFLLRAVAQLKSGNWTLNICNDGPERRPLEELAQKLGVAYRTRFWGAVDDIAGQYRAATILLTASVLEQYSLTIMEAYAFGVPCIGIRPDWRHIFNSNEDQIKHGETGYLVTDERDMADKIDYLLTHERERRSMGLRAYTTKTENFSFEAYYQTIAGLL